VWIVSVAPQKQNKIKAYQPLLV